METKKCSSCLWIFFHFGPSLETELKPTFFLIFFYLIHDSEISFLSFSEIFFFLSNGLTFLGARKKDKGNCSWSRKNGKNNNRNNNIKKPKTTAETSLHNNCTNNTITIEIVTLITQCSSRNNTAHQLKQQHKFFLEQQHFTITHNTTTETSNETKTMTNPVNSNHLKYFCFNLLFVPSAYKQ